MAMLKNYLTKLTVICNDCSNYTVIAGGQPSRTY